MSGGTAGSHGQPMTKYAGWLMRQLLAGSWYQTLERGVVL
jgi:hypothetical protein